MRFNGSTVGERWLCQAVLRRDLGPEGGVLRRFHGSRVRGRWSVDTCRARGSVCVAAALQWVHGRRTVVIALATSAATCPKRLQWVHGRRTVVIQVARRDAA